MENFIAIDFETANFERSSVCSVGIICVKNGKFIDKFYSLINPRPNYYTARCSNIHGITGKDTVNAASFPQVWEQIISMLKSHYEDYMTIPFVAHNSPFDESCLKEVFNYHNIPYPNYTFYDTLKAARASFPMLANHQLHTVSAQCGYNLNNHHHALADAEACAHIALKLL